MTFTILDEITRPGSEARANEDRRGVAIGGGAAFVIDGATGLGETRLTTSHGSDAAWLAAAAAGELSARLGSAEDLVETTAAICEGVRSALVATLGGEAALNATPTYALPTAGFQMLRVVEPGVGETAGLGDCALILVDADGRVMRATGSRRSRSDEQNAARAAIAEIGPLDGSGGIGRHPEVLRRLRAARDRHNAPDGDVFTIGVEPRAAAHLVVTRLIYTPPARVVLATDGFADLVDLFAAYDAAELVEAAARDGLEPLVAELRRYEREVDPEGRRYPRFKRSDDATAMLLEIG